MYGVISPSEATATDQPPSRPKVHGATEITFRHDHGATRLGHLYHRDPLRVLFPAPPSGDIPLAALVTVSGGMVGGDQLDIAVRTEAGAKALFAAQAAEKVYRSTGPDCAIEIGLAAESDSWLEWMPQETILYEGARLRRRTVADIDPTARLMAGEIIVLGRRAMGERVTRGLLRDDWEVRIDGRLVWADALRLDGDIAATVDHPAGLGGAAAIGTVIVAGQGAADRLDLTRELLEDTPEDVRCGATVVNGVLLVRWLSVEPFALRRAFGTFWARYRHAAGGLPERLPRLWHI